MKSRFPIILYLITVIYANDVPLLEISNGWLQGTLETSYNGRTFSAFEGIPYAKPPVGNLRFEPPQEPYNWTGTWIASTKHTCMYATGPDAALGQEDCLYLNVYVPRTKPNSFENLNVIVHIHGGGFVMWDAHTYSGPKYLMDEEVIYVTMNYRLGALGFLSTEDNVVPGNNGFKDQVLSLKWIQNNIEYFGGNPESVTITGMSAGATSVHLHYFSALSKGLFHRGVSQSGTALDPWVIRNKPLDKAKGLAKLVGCSVETSSELVKCLKTRSANEILKTCAPATFDNPNKYPSFGPVIEMDHEGAFLTENPYDMLLADNVADLPWIVSATEEEGLFAVNLLPMPLPEFYEQFEKYAPSLLMYDDIDDQALISSITNKIKDHYFKGTNAHDITNNIAQLFSDRMFLVGADTSAKLQAKTNRSPVYFYIFGYRGQHTLMDMLIPNTNSTNATHGDDVLYYLHSSVAEERLSEQDEKMKSVFLQWLTTFADGQAPKLNDVTWKPVTDDNDKLLEYILFEDGENFFIEQTEGFGYNELWSSLPIRGSYAYKNIKDEL